MVAERGGGIVRRMLLEGVEEAVSSAIHKRKAQLDDRRAPCARIYGMAALLAACGLTG